MSQRFKHEEKSSGKLNQDVIEYLKTYEEASVDYKLLEAQLLQTLHNFVDSDTKHLNREMVVPHLTTSCKGKHFCQKL